MALKFLKIEKSSDEKFTWLKFPSARAKLIQIIDEQLNDNDLTLIAKLVENDILKHEALKELRKRIK